jgi:RimJ/RimL family protein N-acetyltransferase
MELPERVRAMPVALRHFAAADAHDVRRLADDWEVARWTAALPHPYADGMAEAWIAGHAGARERTGEHVFAITRAGDGALVGSLGVRPEANVHGHFGYWIGRAHWGAGYATAATRAAIAILFARTDLDAVWAVHLADNVGSARVMAKCGLQVLRNEERTHRGEPRAFHVRGITREAWEAQRGCE